jgi:putative membrane protein
MSSMDAFGFQAQWSPYFLSILVLVTIGYLLLTVKYRERFRDSELLTKSEASYFTVAIVLLYIIKGSPVDLLGHLMFSVHMVQMAVLYLIIAPLMIKGIPNWLWKKLLSIRSIKMILQFFTKPLIILILFNGMFSFYHIPLIFDFIKTDMWLHGGYTALLFVMAILMWWPLVNKVPEYQNLNGIKKIGYIFANGILLTPACALIIFADRPMSLTYSDPAIWAEALKLCVSPAALASLNVSGPEMFNSLPLIDDQQLGGVIMKIIQEIVYGIVLAQVFFKWYREEQKDSQAEASATYHPQYRES